MKMSNAESGFISLLERFFEEYLPSTVNASPHTVASYKCAFRLLFRYLNEEHGIKPSQIAFEQLDFELLCGFSNWMTATRKNSKSTAKQRVAALASFADYAECRNLEAACVFRNSLKKLYKKAFQRVKGKQRSSFSRQELEILFLSPTLLRNLVGEILSFWQ